MLASVRRAGRSPPSQHTCCKRGWELGSFLGSLRLEVRDKDRALKFRWCHGKDKVTVPGPAGSQRTREEQAQARAPAAADSRGQAGRGIRLCAAPRSPEAGWAVTISLGYPVVLRCFVSAPGPGERKTYVFQESGDEREGGGRHGASRAEGTRPAPEPQGLGWMEGAGARGARPGLPPPGSPCVLAQVPPNRDSHSPGGKRPLLPFLLLPSKFLVESVELRQAFSFAANSPSAGLFESLPSPVSLG